MVQLQLDAGIDQLWAIIRVHLFDLSPTAEMFDSPDNGVSVSPRSWISHNESSVYVPNDERIPALHFMISRCRHEVECHHVPECLDLLLKAPVRDLRCLIFALTHDSQKGFRHFGICG